MPDVEDHNVGEEILLPRGDKMARGHIVAQSCDANGNVIPCKSNFGYNNESQEKLPGPPQKCRFTT